MGTEGLCSYGRQLGKTFQVKWVLQRSQGANPAHTCVKCISGNVSPAGRCLRQKLVKCVCVCLPLPSPKQGEWCGQNGVCEGKGELVATKSGRMMMQGGLILEDSVSLLVK